MANWRSFFFLPFDLDQDKKIKLFSSPRKRCCAALLLKGRENLSLDFFSQRTGLSR
jgi:hypothetical protein